MPTRSALGGARAEVVDDRGGEVDERDLERPGDRGDHLARGLLEPALDLGQVLRRDARAIGGVGEALAAIMADAAQPVAERVAPERLRRPRDAGRFVGSGMISAMRSR